MHFKSIIESYNKKIILYVDMDGVIADYEVGKPFDFINKRPLIERIEKLEIISNMPNVEMRRWNLVGDSLKIEATMSVGDSAVRRELGFRVESLRNDTLTLIAGDSFTYYVRKH